MPRVQLTGYIIVPESDAHEVAAALPEHIRLTQAEPGCIKFSVTQSQTQPERYDVAEEFASMPDFEAHQVRVRESAWGAVTKNVERHYEIVELPEQPK